MWCLFKGLDNTKFSKSYYWELHLIHAPKSLNLDIFCEFSIILLAFFCLFFHTGQGLDAKRISGFFFSHVDLRHFISSYRMYPDIDIEKLLKMRIFLFRLNGVCLYITSHHSKHYNLYNFLKVQIVKFLF